MAGMPRKPAALEGLKVVSMAEQYSGPFCTMHLSDMGADVIQVEHIVRHDGIRQRVLRQPIKFSAYDNVPTTRAPPGGRASGRRVRLEGFGLGC